MPIVNERKVLYDIIDKELDTGDLLDEIDDPNIIKKSNEQDIIDFAALREKYESKKTQNYSYRREINEQNNLTNIILINLIMLSPFNSKMISRSIQ